VRPFSFARYIFSLILKLWVQEINGLENLPKNQAFMLCPNHCSYIEHFIIGAITIPYLNKKIHILAKKEHYDSFVQRTWHRLWNSFVYQIPIDRNKGEKALKTAVHYLKRGAVLVIYPEGTRSLTEKIQKGKTGVARLSLWAKVPVVPLGIIGTFGILPKGKIIPKMKKAKLNFGKPIYFDKYYDKPITKKMLRAITTRIMLEIAKLSNQSYDY